MEPDFCAAASILSLPSNMAAPAPLAGRASRWAGAVGARVESPGQKLLHFVVMAPCVPDEASLGAAISRHVTRATLEFDAPLTPEGLEQCRQLQQLTDSVRPDLFVTSPLTRTAQTTLLSFGPQLKATGARIIALDDVRDTVNNPCDARRTRTELAADFPAIDFSGCTETDIIWAKYERRHGLQDVHKRQRESADAPALAARARRALAWLAARSEKEVVIVSHKDYLWNTFNIGQPDGKFPNLPCIYSFADDDVRRWMCSAFADCEVRSVLADFDPPPKPGTIGGRVMPTSFGI